MFAEFLGTEINTIAIAHQIAISSNRICVIIKMITVFFIDAL